ncbi:MULTISPECIES: cell division protein FtsB [Idiomarina]|jgi:cell division protein FtsB|uniref:Cell division protein FtsB n=2 Tax=Idiomarina TaxID=135575 RepID=A0A432YBL8_9GAMM|nr:MULTISPECIES: cell division protein FtsB [Idiomarina]MBL73549.1 cell division protein FtsB [Idiomarinaceae bacterium]MEC8924665.1 cell division protein FtsB [Pseudomonadota bacterium]EAQ32062.1 Septum formation initiator, FtsB [Idiomarina baltica OS145]KXS35726.1 MAG: cell division protein FtsB [Idiomarina sp. T82-3]MBR38417.1 cell division protein FtsB [Idiomarina sp.]|tara:strand:- start:1185 stop:1472 length:288 start_codon:yes stop_codon:yes gene_type:complete
MRIVIILLVGVLAALQYRLWFGKNSLPDYWRLQQEVQHQRKANDNLARRNEVLYADIKDLREGEDALEERARNELGMIKKEEVFFRLVHPRRLEQ